MILGIVNASPAKQESSSERFVVRQEKHRILGETDTDSTDLKKII